MSDTWQVRTLDVPDWFTVTCDDFKEDGSFTLFFNQGEGVEMAIPTSRVVMIRRFE